MMCISEYNKLQILLFLAQVFTVNDFLTLTGSESSFLSYVLYLLYFLMLLIYSCQYFLIHAGSVWTLQSLNSTLDSVKAADVHLKKKQFLNSLLCLWKKLLRVTGWLESQQTTADVQWKWL